MKDEDREEIIRALDQMASQIGASSFDEVAAKARQLIPIARLIIAAVENFGSRDQLPALFEQVPDLEPKHVELIVALIKSIPTMVKKELPKFEAVANQVLPAAPKGRPGASAAFKRQVCDFILDLFGKGVPLTICKQRAARQFAISYRAVEYHWAERGELNADLDAAKAFAKDLLLKKLNEALPKADKSETQSSKAPSSENSAK